MSNQESRDSQQAKQRQDQELLRSERQVRGELRNAHLEAGREQARSDNALARAGSASTAAPEEDTPDQRSDDEYEAKLRLREDAGRAAMKAEARSRYEGSDGDFERNWPDIGEQPVTETMENDLKHMPRGLKGDVSNLGAEGTSSGAGDAVAPELYGVYCSDDTLPPLEQAEWVIKGTDGEFYMVSSAPGGWMQRVEFQGEIGKLVAPLAQNEARSVCWTVYGDVGPVTMEGADLEPQ